MRAETIQQLRSATGCGLSLRIQTNGSAVLPETASRRSRSIFSREPVRLWAFHPGTTSHLAIGHGQKGQLLDDEKRLSHA